MSTISQSVLDKLRDDITEAVSFWNTISNHRNLRSELSAADVIALLTIIKQRDLENELLYRWRENEAIPVPYVLPTDISTESLAYKKPAPIVPDSKKSKGKKK